MYHLSNPVRRDRTERLQLVILQSLTEGIVEQAHSAEYGGGHYSSDKTYDKIRARYYWNNMYKDVVQFVSSCSICKARKLKKVSYPMQDMLIPEYPFQIIGIDTCGPFPETASGNKYIVTIVDHFSSWPEAYPVQNKTAETVASLLLEHFIPTHSCPQTMLSDRGTEFVNKVISLLLNKMKISHIKTSSYHPQTNGKTERFHRYMNDVLAKYIRNEPYNWDKYIPSMLMAYRTSVQDSTLFTPYFLVFGRDPILPMDTLLQPKLKYMGDEYVPVMLERLHKAYMDAKVNLSIARTKNKENQKGSKGLPNFQPGDPVFYLDPTKITGVAPKLTLAWKPHFRIVEQKSPVTYLIKDQLSGKAKVVHAENLHLASLEQVWDSPRDKYERLDMDSSRPEAPTRIQPPRRAKLSYGTYDLDHDVQITNNLHESQEQSISPENVALEDSQGEETEDQVSSSESDVEMSDIATGHGPQKRKYEITFPDIPENDTAFSSGKRQKFVESVNVTDSYIGPWLSWFGKPLKILRKVISFR